MSEKGQSLKLDILYQLKDKGVSEKNIKWVSQEIDKLIKEQEELENGNKEKGNRTGLDKE